MDKDTIGKWGEHLAARWLRKNRRKVLYRNYRAPHGGEVDIVWRHGDTLSFVEVKTRTSTDFGRPGQAVTPAKDNDGSATVDILPVYAHDEQGDRASPGTPAQTLLVWNLNNRGGVFGKLHTGDFLRAVNGRAVNSVQQVVDALKATPAGEPAVLAYDSQDTQTNASAELPASFVATVTPPGTIARIGAMFKPQTIVLYTTPLEQFRSAFGQIFGMLRSLFNPHSDIGIGQLAGPIGISRMIYQFSMQDVRLALWFVFIINVNLAIINLLPIPLLDGGHILFYTIERLRRRALPVNVIATAQAVCLVLLLGLALFVFFNDSRRWLGDSESNSDALRYRVYWLHDDDVKYPVAPDSGK